MKKQVSAIILCVCFFLGLTSCKKDERSQAKQLVQDFLEAVKNDNETKASLLMPFLTTVSSQEKEALLSFFKDISSEKFLLSVPEKKGSLYTVTLSMQGSGDSIIHYSFEVKKEAADSWIILENVTQKITYDSFML